jgi:methyltransferase-like protein
MVAMLHGMLPAPPERCRVLELGCGDACNILPMALEFPESEFVGVDLSVVHIENGRSMADALGLKNLSLRTADLMEMATDFGEFDYIIAHGLYSWVPCAVREQLLAICRGSLAENGLAFISYNALPGGHLRSLFRGMMLFRTEGITAPEDKVREARALAEMVMQTPLPAVPIRNLLVREAERIREYRDHHLFHDDLAEINDPCYFHEFAAAASRHGLQYLAEADLHENEESSLPGGFGEWLDRMAGDDVILRQQYLDFLKCRRFRQTLLCRAETTVDRVRHPERIAELFLACPAASVSPTDPASHEMEEFRLPGGTSLSSNRPLTKAALHHLIALWPQSVLFTDLLKAARERVGQDPMAGGARELAASLFRMALVSVVELYAGPFHFTLAPGERPLVSPLVRLQLRDSDTATNLRHWSIQAEDSLSRHLLRLMDGTRHRAAVAEELSRLVESGASELLEGGEPFREPARIRELIAGTLDQNIAKFARLAVFLE